MSTFDRIIGDTSELMFREKLPYALALQRVLTEHGNETAYQRINAEAKNLMERTPGLKYADAVQTVTEEHPSWYHEYSNEVRGVLWSNYGLQPHLCGHVPMPGTY